GGFGDFNPHYVPIGIFGHDPEAPVYAQDLARAEELFRSVENPNGGGSYWDTGFTVTVVAEGQNLFEIAAIVLKDSMTALNPLFDIQVAGVAEAEHQVRPVRQVRGPKQRGAPGPGPGASPRHSQTIRSKRADSRHADP
ncbi:MAG TPA: hypothetical protein VLS86_07995, partial [Acidimicrobiia bacterium]|nr:hypothetical protein [Acidimicrobiia bacterium]